MSDAPFAAAAAAMARWALVPVILDEILTPSDAALIELPDVYTAYAEACRERDAEPLGAEPGAWLIVHCCEAAKLAVVRDPGRILIRGVRLREKKPGREAPAVDREENLRERRNKP